MRSRFIALAVSAILAIPFVLVACGKPMANKTLDDPNRDDSAKMMKQAGE